MPAVRRNQTEGEVRTLADGRGRYNAVAKRWECTAANEACKCKSCGGATRPKCHHTYKNKGELQSHYDKHHGTGTQLTCRRGCGNGQVFSCTSNRTRHELGCMGSATVKCEKCGTRISRKDNRKRHDQKCPGGNHAVPEATGALEVRTGGEVVWQPQHEQQLEQAWTLQAPTTAPDHDPVLTVGYTYAEGATYERFSQGVPETVVVSPVDFSGLNAFPSISQRWFDFGAALEDISGDTQYANIGTIPPNIPAANANPVPASLLPALSFSSTASTLTMPGGWSDPMLPAMQQPTSTAVVTTGASSTDLPVLESDETSPFSSDFLDLHQDDTTWLTGWDSQTSLELPLSL